MCIFGGGAAGVLGVIHRLVECGSTECGTDGHRRRYESAAGGEGICFEVGGSSHGRVMRPAHWCLMATPAATFAPSRHVFAVWLVGGMFCGLCLVCDGGRGGSVKPIFGRLEKIFSKIDEFA